MTGTSNSTLTALSNGEQTPEQVRTLLTVARKVIESPESWTVGAWGKSSDGRTVGWNSPECVCRCAEGALRYANWQMDRSYRELRLAERALARAFAGAPTYECPAKFNDSASHAEVLAAFDKAIASLSNDRVQSGDSGGVA